jgi:glycosyltransferase involved in cell wall biosynthesis
MSYPSGANQPIDVLHLITRLIVGGAQENTMYSAQLLDQYLYTIDVVSGIQTGSEGSLIDEIKSRGISLSFIPELVRELNPILDLIALVKLILLIRKKKYSIVHTHSSKAGILGRLAARISGVPIIVHTIHGWSFHDHMSPILRSLYVNLERITASFSDRLIVVAVSDIQKGLQEKIASESKYTLIRSAFPVDEFTSKKIDRKKVRQSLGIPITSPVLGNVGRFSFQKNPLDWIKIASKVGKRLPDCYFLMVGDGPLRHDAERLMETECIRDRVITTGLRRDIPQMLKAMDVFLLTSLWEGLPRVIPQAMLMELPVIAYRTDGAAEAISHGKTGFLCEQGDLTTAAEYCCNLLTDKELCHKIGARSKQYASQNFNLSKMIDQIENIYLELLHQKAIR